MDQNLYRLKMADVELVAAQAKDYDIYYSFRCDTEDIYWNGFAYPPDYEKLKGVFNNRLWDSDISVVGNKRIYLIKYYGESEKFDAGFLMLVRASDGIEFGVTVIDKYRGKGIGSKAIKIAVELSKSYTNRVYARIRDDNYASRGAFKKNGFIRSDDYEIVNYPLAGEGKFRKWIKNISQ